MWWSTIDTYLNNFLPIAVMNTEMKVTIETNDGKTFSVPDVTFAKNTDDGGVYVEYGNHDMKEESRYNDCYIVSVEGSAPSVP